MPTVLQASEFGRPAGTIIGIEEELRGELLPGVPDLLARMDLLVDDGDGPILDRPQDRPQAVEPGAGARLGRATAPYTTRWPSPWPGDGRPIRLAFVVLTKTKTLEVCWHEVQADRRQIDRGESALSSGFGVPWRPASSPRARRRCSARRVLPGRPAGE